MAFFITKKLCVNRTELTVWQQICPACWAIGETNPKKPSSVEKALCGQSVQRGTGTAGEEENEAFKDSKLLCVPGKAVALHPDKLWLFKWNLCGPVRRNVSLKIFDSELFEVFWAFVECSLSLLLWLVHLGLQSMELVITIVQLLCSSVWFVFEQNHVFTRIFLLLKGDLNGNLCYPFKSTYLFKNNGDSTLNTIQWLKCGYWISGCWKVF